MKLLELSIASIVDANTGHGFPKNLRAELSVDIHKATSNSHTIRSRSIAQSFGFLKTKLANFIAKSKKAAIAANTLKELSAMDDHILQDIGLSRDDLFSVATGQRSLDAISEERERAIHPLVSLLSAVEKPNASEHCSSPVELSYLKCG